MEASSCASSPLILSSSSSYQYTGQAVAVRYTQGNWNGELGADLVSIPEGPNGTVPINIAAILSSEGFFLPDINWQGILGLAYPLLARVRKTCFTGLSGSCPDGQTPSLNWFSTHTCINLTIITQTLSTNLIAVKASRLFRLFPFSVLSPFPYPSPPQPDPSVTPFFDSLVQQLGIPDIFSLQMCGAGLSASRTVDEAEGSLVSSGREGVPVR